MKRLDYLPLALTGLVALAAPAAVFAQSETAAGSASRGRSANERVNTEASIPPPANSDYRRAAEGTLPQIPGAVGTPGGAAIDPAALPLGARSNPIAPANGTLGTTATPLTPGVGAPALPPGMDTAMLIEHALGMGINSSLLSSLAASNNPDEAGNDAVKALMKQADDELRDCRDLMSKAAAAGSTLGPESPIRGFYHAANEYMKSLESLSTPGMMALANNKAELAAINQAVQDSFDASHIAQFGGGAGTPAMDSLLGHARSMKDNAGKTLERIGGTNPIDPSMPASPMTLARKGRDLLAAADALAPMAAQTAGTISGGGMDRYPNNGLNPSMNVGPGPFPGKLQNNNAGVLGGTLGVGSPSENVATGAEAARNVKNSTELPNGVLEVPTPSGAPGSGPSGYGVGNNNTPPTNSTAGSRPR